MCRIGYTDWMPMRRSLIAVLMVLWLPLQGFAAVAMPFCKHAMHGTQSIAPGHGHPGQQAVAEHAHHRAAATSEHGTPPSPHTHGSVGLDCNDCGACHLACAPAVLPAQKDLLVVSGEHYPEVSPSVPPLFIPEQHKRPPLAAVV